jgi:hypothetical protein
VVPLIQYLDWDMIRCCKRRFYSSQVTVFLSTTSLYGDGLLFEVEVQFSNSRTLLCACQLGTRELQDTTENGAESHT